MTDRETLFLYRLREADETLADAEQMLIGGVSPRSVVNRSYYAVFYFILALFQKGMNKGRFGQPDADGRFSYFVV